MADARSFTHRVTNYYMNANVRNQNFTVIVPFTKDDITGVSEVAIVFVDKALDQIDTKVHVAGRRLIKQMPISFCQSVVDMLRHEKPIFARYGFTPGPNPSSESFDIFTHLEEIGEEES